MTIRQQGGVFGRNPKFNTLDTDGNTNLGDGVVQVDAASKEVGINTNPSVEFDVRGTGGFGELQVGGSNTAVKNVIYGDNNGGLILYADKDNVASSSSLRFYVDGTEAARFNSSRNLAFQDGKGIDFSATSGTGTSELFDDYEEGTWTPVYDASTSSPTVTHDKQTGYYVKIGRMVFISLQLRTDSVSGGSGNLRISGLPYSASSGDGYPSALSVGYKADFVTNGPDFAHVNDGQTYLSLYSNGTTVATPLTVANLNTGSNDNGLYISGSYLTA